MNSTKEAKKLSEHMQKQYFGHEIHVESKCNEWCSK